MKMNSSDTKAGGWPRSDARSYLSNFYYRLPDELKSVIINTKVVSGYGRYDNSNFISSDKLYLLDAKEIFGTSFNQQGHTARDYQRQLDYYAVTLRDNSNVVNKKYYGSPEDWFLRSQVSNTFKFYYVHEYAGLLSYRPTQPMGISPAFRIG